MKKSDFFYNLPERLIAQTPLQKRDSSRLMVINRESGDITDKNFRDIKDYLKCGDMLVLNDSRVIPARVFCKTQTGAAIELLLIRDIGNNCWESLVKPGRRCKVSTILLFNENLRGEIIEVLDNGNRIIKFDFSGNFLEILSEIGVMPLPHYIKESLQDKERYQTVYSKDEGSVAAPTAGLHFTDELLQELQDMGVVIVRVTLHVGIGTFRPVKTEIIEEHTMHHEFYTVSEESAEAINAQKESGGRIICVGTTSMRVLESVCDDNGMVRACSGSTDIFIYPPYKIKVADGIITNFHLPESTLIMLISALYDREKILAAYKRAVDSEYRFFSFGDAMFIY